MDQLKILFKIKIGEHFSIFPGKYFCYPNSGVIFSQDCQEEIFEFFWRCKKFFRGFPKFQEPRRIPRQ